MTEFIQNLPWSVLIAACFILFMWLALLIVATPVALTIFAIVGIFVSVMRLVFYLIEGR